MEIYPSTYTTVFDLYDLEEKKARKFLIAHSLETGEKEIMNVIVPFLDAYLEMSGRDLKKHSKIIPLAMESYRKLMDSTDLDMHTFLREMSLIMHQEGYEFCLANKFEAQLEAQKNKTCLVLLEVPTETLHTYKEESFLYVAISPVTPSLTKAKEKSIIHMHEHKLLNRFFKIKAFAAITHVIAPYLLAYHKLHKISILELSMNSGIAENSFIQLRRGLNILLTTFIRIFFTYYKDSGRHLCIPNLCEAILRATKNRTSLIQREVTIEELKDYDESQWLFVYANGRPPGEKPKESRRDKR